PAEWQDYLFSDELVDYAMEHYDALDVDSSGALTPDELVPVIVSMSEAKPWDIDEEQCRRFVAIFDKDRSGKISSA
ncbi:MAG: EF-hand domain-containing protein, partial [Pseudomonadota bacterium]|nr:EF-hand domain-containing protein [Pseudomonadota bacterium]MEC8585889.1 EF-hand domain-containing protein [Pseudomonadota bacterium]